MGRAGTQPAEQAESPAPKPHEPAPIRPPRKRPWLLAVAVLLLVAWFVFMAVIAVRY